LFLAPSPNRALSVNCFREPQAETVKSCQDQCGQHRDSVGRKSQRNCESDTAFKDRSAEKSDDAGSREDDCQNSEHGGRQFQAYIAKAAQKPEQENDRGNQYLEDDFHIRHSFLLTIFYHRAADEKRMRQRALRGCTKPLFERGQLCDDRVCYVDQTLLIGLHVCQISLVHPPRLMQTLGNLIDIIP
jgi:hypothetical protein